MLIITATQQHLRKFVLLPRTGNNCLTSIVRSWPLIATSYNSKSCCEVWIIQNRKIQASKWPATPLQFPYIVSYLCLSSLHLRLSVRTLNAKEPRGCGEAQVNCQGSQAALAPTSLHSSWQHILNKATRDRPKAHPGTGSSPGNDPPMETLKAKSPRLYSLFRVETQKSLKHSLS